MRSAAAISCFVVLGAGLLHAGGCVERTVKITSEPAGALVWVNDREVGRTPVDFKFLHYGDYDVRLALDGYEPLLTNGQANAPIWDHVPLDLAAELVPARLESNHVWHYTLEPQEHGGEALVQRAREMQGAMNADASDPAAEEAQSGEAEATTP